MYKITFLFLFCASFAFAQNRFHFDHVLEYDYQETIDSPIEKYYILSNAADNSYVLNVKSEDEKMLALDFIQQDKLVAKIKVKEVDFLRAETLLVDCEDVWPLTNKYKLRTEEYEYVQNPDTVLYNQKYPYYILKHVDPEYEEEDNRIVRGHYIIQPGTSYHLPVLRHCTAYEEWKKEKSIPNGIFAYKYFISREADTTGIYKLRKIHKVDKYLKYPADCEPSNPTFTTIR